MSHIPETAMKHAQVHDAGPSDTDLLREDPTLGPKVADAADRAVKAAKANPKTAIGIGAAVVAGIAAVVAAPAVIAKVKDAPKTKAARKTPRKAK